MAFTTDAGGNTIVRRQGTNVAAYLNKPGASGIDLMRLGGQGAAFYAAMNPLSGIASLPARAGLMGLSGAGTSAALDVAAGAAGSEQGISGERAALAGVGGAVGEFIAPTLGPIYRAIVRRPKLYKNGN